jgi:hypothetical protein
MAAFKTVYDVSKDAMAVIGTGYMIHKVYTVVDLAVAKIQAVKTALTGTTAVAAAKTVAKS